MESGDCLFVWYGIATNDCSGFTPMILTNTLNPPTLNPQPNITPIEPQYNANTVSTLFSMFFSIYSPLMGRAKPQSDVAMRMAWMPRRSAQLLQHRQPREMH